MELILYRILNHYDLNCTPVEVVTYTNEEWWEVLAWLSLTVLLDCILSPPLAMWTFLYWGIVIGEIGSICDQGHWWTSSKYLLILCCSSAEGWWESFQGGHWIVWGSKMVLVRKQIVVDMTYIQAVLLLFMMEQLHSRWDDHFCTCTLMHVQKVLELILATEVSCEE